MRHVWRRHDDRYYEGGFTFYLLFTNELHVKAGGRAGKYLDAHTHILWCQPILVKQKTIYIYIYIYLVKTKTSWIFVSGFPLCLGPGPKTLKNGTENGKKRAENGKKTFLDRREIVHTSSKQKKTFRKR